MRTIRILPIILLFAACSSNKNTVDAHIILSDSNTTIDAPGLNLVDSYVDRDTFQFTTGAATDQLSVRLNWPGTSSDLDYFLFPVNSTTSIASGSTTATMEDEFTTFAVKPSTAYWLWVGQYGAMGTPAAATYDASVCGETFVVGTQTCGFTETMAQDLTNDYAVMGYVAPSVGNYTSGIVVCGNIDAGHYGSSNKRVDIDAFNVTTTNTAPQDIIFSFVAPGANVLDSVTFEIYDNPNNVSLGGGTFLGNHGIATGAFPAAGTYEIDVSVHHNSAINTSIPYKIKISNDTPATRCVKATTAASYVESHDGADNKGNDMIEINYANTMGPTTLTASTTDMPEPTGLTIAPNMEYRISGTSPLPQ